MDLTIDTNVVLLVTQRRRQPVVAVSSYGA